MDPRAFLELEAVHKRFAGVHALRGVDLSIHEGEVHCLAGENGSGKSTLIKVIAGVHAPEEGRVRIGGSDLDPITPLESIRRGVQVIYQDFSLFPNLSVAENLALNNEVEQGRRFVRWSRIRATAREALARIRRELPLDRPVGELPVADRQLVAIARALLHDARLVIMDEPTTALTQREVENLFTVIENLRSEGIATLFVSHKLREVLRISERLTVLRNGSKVAEGPTTDFDERGITEAMTGRAVREEKFSYARTGNHPPALEVEGLGRPPAYEHISFRVDPGEIVGITGLLGSGRTELALGLFGLLPARAGIVRLGGQPLRIRSVQEALAAGIAYVPEDRLTEGLFLEQSIHRNIIASILPELAGRFGFLDFAEARRQVEEWIRDFGIATPNAEVPAQSLSGGNQQRVLLARWLARTPRVLVLNGPTVGVDVGSKEAIHQRLRALAAEGMAILLLSDDLPEVVSNCNRVLLLREGRLAAEFEESVTEDTLNAHFAETAGTAEA
jgi:simple sugar transport system ATP-binding protein